LQLWRPVGSFFDQWVAWREGRQSIDISEMRSALAQFRIGFQPLVPLSAMLLAEIEGERGESDTALFLLEDLLKEIERTGQRWLDAEVHRQRGELLLRRRPVDTIAAEAAFELALATARGQHARTFELRAATDLARLWRDQDKRDTARNLLAAVYGSFFEACSTRDLEEAQTLLKELA
jgi:predicted ATPase